MRLPGLAVFALIAVADVTTAQSSAPGGDRRFPRTGFELVYGGCCEPLRVDQHQGSDRPWTARMGGFALRRVGSPAFAGRFEGLLVERRSSIRHPGMQGIEGVGPPFDESIRDLATVATLGGELSLRRGRAFSSLAAGIGGIRVRTEGERVFAQGRYSLDRVDGTGEIWSFAARFGYGVVFGGAQYLVLPHPVGSLRKSIGMLTVGTQW